MALLSLPWSAMGKTLSVISAESADLSVIDGTTEYLSISYYDWGPGWSGVERKKTVTEQGGGATFSFHNLIQQTQVPFAVEGAWTTPAADTLRLKATLVPGGESGFVMAQFGLKTGAAFDQGRAIATRADGSSVDYTLPFGRNDAVTDIVSLALLDNEGRKTTLTFEAPTEIVTDGEARMVVAKDTLQVGSESTLAVTLQLPAPTNFIAGVDSAKPLNDTTGWFPFRAPAPIPENSEWTMQSWLEAPAGKHGRILRKDGELVYNGAKIQLWGINNSYGACAPDQKLADRRADFYAAMGINAIRLHKYADGTGWSGILTQQSSVEYDAAKLDRLDYYVAALKKRGIYTKLSPVFIIDIGPGDRERVPYMDELGPMQGHRINPKHGSLYLSSELQDLLIEQTVKLLTHTNPYTGMTYAQDPAIAYFELYNEDSALFGGVAGVIARSATLRARAGSLFAEWLKEKYPSEEAFLESWGPQALNCGILKNQSIPCDESWSEDRIYPAGNPWFFDPANLETSQRLFKRRLLDTMAFLYELQNSVYTRYARAIRETGYEGELITSNWQAGRMISHFYNLHSDSRGGTVDRHNYFGGGARTSGPIKNASMVSQPGSGMLSSGLQQVSGHPFMLSEWIHVAPNEWGVEGPAILGAYGMGLQGWDASFAFQNNDDGTFSPSIGAEMWDATAPQFLGVFPAVSRQVLRHDVKRSELVHYRNVHIPSLDSMQVGFEESVLQTWDTKTLDSDVFPAAALAVARSEVRFTEDAEPTKQFDLTSFTKDGVLHASTEQLRWLPGRGKHDGHIVINTPATQAMVGFAEGKTAAMDDSSIAMRSRFGAVYLTARSPEGTLATDSALLVTAIARARNQDAVILNDSYLISRGEIANHKPKGPVVMEGVVAEITLKRNAAATVTVLDHGGVKTGQTIPVENGRFTIDTSRDRSPYYLIEY